MEVKLIICVRLVDLIFVVFGMLFGHLVFNTIVTGIDDLRALKAIVERILVVDRLAALTTSRRVR
jgi:hypothetical protein